MLHGAKERLELFVTGRLSGSFDLSPTDTPNTLFSGGSGCYKTVVDCNSLVAVLMTPSRNLSFR